MATREPMERTSFDGYYYLTDGSGHVWHEDGTTTDPYKDMRYSIGSENDFVCFDYMILEAHVALHATVNSETGGFIQDFDYAVVKPEAAYNVAQGMVDAALSWCAENDVAHDAEGWRDVHTGRDGTDFPDVVQESVMFKLYDND